MSGEDTWTRAKVAAEARREGGVVIVVDNEVYHLPPSFLDIHPGGHEVLIGVAGSDATEDFRDIGHSKDAKEMMAQYRKGELPKHEQKKVKTEAPPTLLTPPPESPRWHLPLMLAVAATVVYIYLPGFF